MEFFRVWQFSAHKRSSAGCDTVFRNYGVWNLLSANSLWLTCFHTSCTWPLSPSHQKNARRSEAPTTSCTFPQVVIFCVWWCIQDFWFQSWLDSKISGLDPGLCYCGLCWTLILLVRPARETFVQLWLKDLEKPLTLVWTWTMAVLLPQYALIDRRSKYAYFARDRPKTAVFYTLHKWNSIKGTASKRSHTLKSPNLPRRSFHQFAELVSFCLFTGAGVVYLFTGCSMGKHWVWRSC